MWTTHAAAAGMLIEWFARHETALCCVHTHTLRLGVGWSQRGREAQIVGLGVLVVDGGGDGGGGDSAGALTVTRQRSGHRHE